MSAGLPIWLTISIVAHIGALAAYLVWPQAWPLALAVVLVNHGLLVFASLWPRSRLMGANMSRLPSPCAGEIALSFDDGPDPEVTPKVLEIMAAHGARASFFCIGERAQAHPDIIKAIIAAGHRVENHSHRHLGYFALLLPRAMARDIAHAQTVLTALAGRPPVYFRAPVGMRNPAMDLVLTAQGLRLVSWTRRGLDTVSHRPDRVLRRLTRGLQAGDILLLHDGASARDRAGAPIVLQVLPQLLQRLAQKGLAVVPIAPPEAVVPKTLRV